MSAPNRTPPFPKSGHQENASANATPRFPKFITLMARLQTFKNFQHWTQSRNDLAIAGFFYTGHRDCVMCFFCEGALSGWKDGDNPWTEHARWFPDCPHVNQRFIDQIPNNQSLAQTDEYINRTRDLSATKTRDQRHIMPLVSYPQSRPNQSAEQSTLQATGVSPTGSEEWGDMESLDFTNDFGNDDIPANSYQMPDICQVAEDERSSSVVLSATDRSYIGHYLPSVHEDEGSSSVVPSATDRSFIRHSLLSEDKGPTSFVPSVSDRSTIGHSIPSVHDSVGQTARPHTRSNIGEGHQADTRNALSLRNQSPVPDNISEQQGVATIPQSNMAGVVISNAPEESPAVLIAKEMGYSACVIQTANRYLQRRNREVTAVSLMTELIRIEELCEISCLEDNVLTDVGVLIDGCIKVKVEKEETICKICMENTVSIVFRPCGHLFCAECAQNDTVTNCAICRQPDPHVAISVDELCSSVSSISTYFISKKKVEQQA